MGATATTERVPCDSASAILYADERAMAVLRGEEDEGAPPSVA
jgi:hypothetical protein